MDGAKMSKSMGNVVRPRGLHRAVRPGRAPLLRVREMVFGQDADFTDEAILTRYNADLANDLGTWSAARRR